MQLRNKEIFIFGGSGFVGQNLIEGIIGDNYQIRVLVRNKEEKELLERRGVKAVIGDVLELNTFLNEIEENSVIFYLIHGLSWQKEKANLLDIEERAVDNLIRAAKIKKARQIIHLTGIYFEEQKLSPHFLARKLTLEKIKNSGIPFTILRTSIIFGKGSISFEIIKNIILKIPLLPIFKWSKSRVSPIHVDDVVLALTKTIQNPAFFNKIIDIGGPEIFSYDILLKKVAKFLKLKRIFINLPLSPFYLPALFAAYSTGFSIREVYFLFQSLKNDCFCSPDQFKKFFGVEPKSIFDKKLFK
ncbi:MAG: NAD(P)H-binding protein [bacterium]|nr:NAD(P)H-binding protein [bacterium]